MRIINDSPSIYIERIKKEVDRDKQSSCSSWLTVKKKGRERERIMCNISIDK
jgi:hypothetical protein